MRTELHRALFALLSRIPGQFGSELTRRVFELKYVRPDPWCISGDEYQRQRYQATLDQVPERYYRKILDVGCGEGHFINLLKIRGS
jgi:2-polyprenyl-3-methyl-5-hydroxy-6-metoxy-1,4-benzoquinol methylase